MLKLGLNKYYKILEMDNLKPTQWWVLYIESGFDGRFTKEYKRDVVAECATLEEASAYIKERNKPKEG